MFVKYGLNRQIMALVGVVELFGAVAIWFQGGLFGSLGAAALLGTSLGAIGCHLIWDTWKDGVPAMITATLSALVLWSGREVVLAQFA
ncbi:DoxX-like family protein [Aliiruegeria lutimaris]|uniref:DoxX-like family protein n=2 Tax=Aliiruegeria lutimaris TaxID=571298 RepID=A0A1G9GH28_9RHOB|nr:DoxX-like family protein [Aliiruegeria lutimaris]